MVRATTQGMYAEEDRLLGQRTERAGQQLTRIIAVLGVLVGATLWVLAKLAVNREIAASSRARMQLSTLELQLESRVTERTAALELEVVERTGSRNRFRESLAERERALKDVADQKFAPDERDCRHNRSAGAHHFCERQVLRFPSIRGKNSWGRTIASSIPVITQRILPGAVGHHREWQSLEGEICNRPKDGWIYWVDTNRAIRR